MSVSPSYLKNTRVSKMRTMTDKPDIATCERCGITVLWPLWEDSKRLGPVPFCLPCGEGWTVCNHDLAYPSIKFHKRDTQTIVLSKECYHEAKPKKG